MNNLVIYTDGAYSSSRNQGGLGIVFTKDGEEIMHFSKMYKDTTNNQMELRAVILALKSIKKPFDSITIVTDSMYVIGCATKGWKKEKNANLWKAYDAAWEQVGKLCPKVEYEWVKGHTDNKFNNLADRLALHASQEIAN